MSIHYHHWDINEVCDHFNVSLKHGLDDIEAGKLLDKYGPNSFEYDANGHTLIYYTLREFFALQMSGFCICVEFLLCLIFGFIYFNEYLITFAVILLILFGIRFIVTLEKVKKSVEYANELDAEYSLIHQPREPQVRVIRQQQKKCQLLVSGYLKKHKIDTSLTRDYEKSIISLISKYCQFNTIDNSKLVPGDIVIVNQGDAIRADMRVVECSVDFMVDHSMITGESESLYRNTKTYSKDELSIEAKNLLFDGTFCTQGFGKAVVFATGANTLMSRVSSLSYVNFGFGEDCTTRAVFKIEKEGILCFLAVIIVLISNIYVQVDILGIVAFICGWVVIVLCLGLILIVWFRVIRLLTNELHDKGLYCKSFDSQTSLANINVIVTDVDGIILDKKKVVDKCVIINVGNNEFKGDDEEKDGDGDGDGVARRKIAPKDRYMKLLIDRFVDVSIDKTKLNNFYQAIELCNKLSISLIVSTRLDQSKADAIWKILFDATPSNNGNKSKNENGNINEIGEDERKDEMFCQERKALNIVNPNNEIHEIEQIAIENVNQNKHNIFSEMDANKRFSLIQNLQNDHHVLFISNGVDDISHLRKSHVGISLGAHLATDIEKYSCDAICTSNYPLKTIVESIGASRKVTQSLVYKLICGR